MTPGEAIAVINKNWPSTSLGQHTELIEALRTAVKALMWRIPLSVTHEATMPRSCTCPRCKNVVDSFMDFNEERVRVKPSICRHCGQVLDWSDVKDENQIS